MKTKIGFAAFASALAAVALATYYASEAQYTPANKEAFSVSTDAAGTRLTWWQACDTNEGCNSKIMYRIAGGVTNYKFSQYLTDVGAPRISRDGKYLTFYGEANGAIVPFVVKTANTHQTPTQVTWTGSSTAFVSSLERFPAPAISDQVTLEEEDGLGFYIVQDDLLDRAEALEWEACVSTDSEFIPNVLNKSLYRVPIKDDLTAGSADIRIVNQEATSAGMANIADQGGKEPTISRDGRWVGWVSNTCENPGAPVEQVYISDCDTNFASFATYGTCKYEEIASADDSGTPGDYASSQPDISGAAQGVSLDKYLIAFRSAAENLTSDDASSWKDIFIRHLGTTSYSPLTWRAYHGNEPSSEDPVLGHANRPQIDPTHIQIVRSVQTGLILNGPKYVAFESTSESILPDGTSSTAISSTYGGTTHVFLANFSDHTDRLCTIEGHVASTTPPAGVDSFWPDISTGATYYAFDLANDSACGSNSGLSKICRKN